MPSHVSTWIDVIGLSSQNFC